MSIAKLVAALVGGVVMTVAAVVSDGHVTSVEWVQLAIAATTAAGVWLAGHTPAGLVWPKTAVAVVLAVLNGLVTALAAGPVTPAEWVNLLVAALTVAGVAVAPPLTSPARTFRP